MAVASREGGLLAAIFLLLGGGVVVLLLLLPPGSDGAPGPGGGNGPGKGKGSEPPPTLAAAAHKLRLGIRLLSTIPAPGPPPGIYAGRLLEPRALVEAVDTYGRPWPRAVDLLLLEGPGAGREVGLASGGGRILLPEGWSLARVETPGWPPFRRLLRARPEGLFALVLPAAAPCTLQGRVFGPDGRPLAGARVEEEGRQVLTDGQGRFALAGVTPGETLLLLSAPGCARALHPVTIGPASAERTLTFVLERGVTLAGTLSFPGRPEPGVRVHLLPDDMQKRVYRFPFGFSAGTESDPSGAFRVEGVPQGMPLRIWAAGAGYITRGAGVRAVALERRRGRVPPIVPLRRTGRIRGRVALADGGPAAGARVRTVPAWSRRVPAGVTPGATTRDLHRALVAGEVIHAFTRRTRCDGRGAYSLSLAVPPSTDWAVECLLDGYTPQRVEGEWGRERYDFTLSPAGTGREGEPALSLRFRERRVEVVLDLRLEGVPLAAGDRWRSADPYRLPLPRPGLYSLEIEWKDGAGWHREEPRRLRVEGEVPLELPF